jgi:hypothetical protein
MMRNGRANTSPVAVQKKQRKTKRSEKSFSLRLKWQKRY